MSTDVNRQTILICDTQPVAMEGIRWMLDNSGDLRCAGTVTTLAAATELAATLAPAAIVLDKSFGTQAIVEWLHQMVSDAAVGPAPVLWGADLTASEALRFIQAGARGIIRRTSPGETMLSCLRAVTSGSTWIEADIFPNAEHREPRHTCLTAREYQVAELVERGLRNRDIGRQLGIQTGTVKIHLRHIFEKTGVRGRYGLALTGLRERGTISAASFAA